MINVQLIIDSLPLLLRGALVTLQISILGCAAGIVCGTLLGVLHTSKNKLIRSIITLYVTLIRGTPMLIQIAFAAYVLPELGLKLPLFWAAILAISANSAAYVSQIIRAGIVSVGSGQIEAARVLGMKQLQITRYIVLPQAFRVVLPALGNEFITLIKDSSLASTIGVVELTKEAWFIRSRTFDALTVYCAVALIYLIMTTTLSFIIDRLERRMSRHVRT